MRLRTTLALLGLTGALTVLLPSTATANCVGWDPDPIELPVTSVSRTFTSGAAWTFDVARHACEGLVLQNVSYKPAGGSATLVLARGSIVAIHVPYLDNGRRYEDVIDGFGGGLGADAHTLMSAECPGTAPGGGSSLFADGTICIRDADGGIRWKNGNSARRAERIQVFMVSEATGYNYVNHWELNDDGTITVKTGLTGQLVSIGSSLAYRPAFGSRIDPETSMTTPKVAIAHQHNVYYRLDFDIAGAGDDKVFRKTFVPGTATSPDGSCSTPGKCGKISYSTIPSSTTSAETMETWSSTSYTSWVITDKTVKNADGRNIGYELVPRVSGIWRGLVGSSEPWAGHEFYATAYNQCEQFATNNPSFLLPAGCESAPEHLAQMVNGESLDGADVVVWYANRLLHYPRDEDDERMPIEWMSFELVPRSFHFQNPSP